MTLSEWLYRLELKARAGDVWLTPGDVEDIVAKVKEAVPRLWNEWPEIPEPMMHRSVDILGVPIRVQNVLHRMGVLTLGQLATTRVADLLRSPNFGRASLRDLYESLNDAIQSHREHQGGPENDAF